MTKIEPRYNVYIVNIHGGAEAKIGTDLTESQADRREMTGLMRIDRDNYFVGSYQVGSKQDMKYSKEVAVFDQK